ncbi:hypothetical protein MXB_3942 [Myxobolus squamalis]|nr:hypothetical protein MXB_3942 [Myxobolus squamalis]
MNHNCIICSAVKSFRQHLMADWTLFVEFIAKNKNSFSLDQIKSRGNVPATLDVHQTLLWTRKGLYMYEFWSVNERKGYSQLFYALRLTARNFHIINFKRKTSSKGIFQQTG